MVKFKDFLRPLSVFKVLFKANLIYKDFSRQSCIFKYFSSLCEPCMHIFFSNSNYPLLKTVQIQISWLHLKLTMKDPYRNMIYTAKFHSTKNTNYAEVCLPEYFLNKLINQEIRNNLCLELDQCWHPEKIQIQPCEKQKIENRTYHIIKVKKPLKAAVRTQKV